MRVGIKEFGRQGWWSRHLFGIGLVLVLFLSAIIRLNRIAGFSGEYDEGAHLMVAWLLAEGYSLYTEVGSTQLPFLYQPTAWLFSIGGPSSVLARWLEIAYALVGIGAVAGIGRILWRPPIGLLAAIFLSLEMYYFRGSRNFGGSVAAVAVGALAVLCALYYQRSGHRKWLVLAGVVYSLSMFIKPLSLFTGVLILWTVVGRRWPGASATVTERGPRRRSFPWRGVLADCLVLGIATSILPLLCLVFYDGGAMVSRIVGCRLAAKVQSTRTGSYLVRILTAYARTNLALLLLAAIASFGVIRRRDKSGVWTIAWLGLSLALIIITRAQTHHLVILDFPLVLLAAYPLGELSDLRGVRRLPLKHWRGVLAVVLLAYWLGSRVLSLSEYYSVAPRGPQWPGDTDRWEAVNLLEHVTTPTQFIVSDDLSIPFEAQRMVVPQLADVSSGSVGCGLLTQKMVMQLADRDGSAFIFWTNRFLDGFPILPHWTQEAYAQRKRFDKEQIVYYDKQVPQIAHPLSVTFRGEIALEGYELSTGSPLELTLFWRKLTPNAANSKVTLRLLNAEGVVAVQYDNWPYNSFFPITAWPVDVLLTERVVLPSTDTLPPGEYALVVGLYEPESLELLAVDGTAEENNDLALLEVLKLGW